MKKYTKKVICLLLGLFFITSCGQTNTQNGKVEGNSDPQLVLKKLTIFGEDVFEKGVDDEKNMSYLSKEQEIRSNNIYAYFDYGEKKDKKIGVSLEGGYFTVDKTKATPMKMKVRAKPGLYQEWTGSVMITLREQDMEVLIAFDGQQQQSGTETLIKFEVVEFIVQCREDIVEEVIINDEKEDHKFKLEETQNMQGSTIYMGSLKLFLDTEKYRQYKVTAIPKDPKVYLKTEVSYSLKGTKIADDNAKFIYSEGEKPEPNIYYDMTWEADCESNFAEDYGVKSLKMTAYTESPRASVFLKRVNPLDDSTIGTEIELTSDGKGMHQTNIELFDDKTTHLVLYVKSKNNTFDNEKGKWQKEFNALDLFWGYDDTKLSTEELRKGAGRGYSEITVEKSKIVGNKVYIAFSIWDEKIGFTPSDSVKAMSDFKKLDTTGEDEDNLVTTYQFTVDGSSLNGGDSKDIEIPIMRIPAGEESTPQIKAFTYKFKLKVM